MQMATKPKSMAAAQAQQTVTAPASANAAPAAPNPQPPAATATAPAPAQAVAPIKGSVALPDGMLDTLEGFEGAGMEQVGARDILIPRLTILQTLSPQVKRGNVQQIAGAEVGMFCDVGLGEIFEAPMHVLPVKWSKSWIEWAPRASGKGIVAIHDETIMAKTVPDDRGRPTFNGNLVAETAQWYVLNLSAGGRPTFIAMASTQLKRSRRWMTMAQAERLRNEATQREFMPPLFYRSYYLTTPVLEQKGDNDWYSWMIERGPALPELPDWKNILHSATMFRDSISREQMQADLRAATDDPSQGEGDTINADGTPVEGRM